MENQQSIHIVGFCGSLRKDSYNLKLLKAAGELLPSHAKFTIADISQLPHYNQDLEANLPKPVVDLIDLAKSADAIVIATPEFNYSIPGVLKTALDWLSRQYADWPLKGKPAAIMGATPGTLGTVRAQMQLRQILLALDTRTVTRPEVYVGQVKSKFDENGNLIDETTRDFVKQLMDNLVQEIRK